MASIDDPPASTPAPDLRIRGDEVTLHPSGYVESPSQTARDEEKEEALMKHMARFRSEPFAFLREVSMYVSGTGWRAYDKVIGQPIFYAGFSENMKTMVIASPILQDRIKQLAEMRVAVEEKEGRFTRNGTLDNSLKSTRQRALFAQLEEVADIWLDKMICKFESKTFIRGAYYLVTQLLLRAYHQGIHVSSEEVLRLHKIAEEAEKKKQSIIFLPCHKSHVDYVSMQLICYRLGLALPTVVSGDNLNFPVVGSFLQHAGAMWIRRSFGDDALYPTLVQAYIDTLLQGGFNFECFIEGGRSRTGKLLSPKFGILGFVLDSILSGRVEDAIICPVSTQYDKVIETEGYVNELLGVPKKKENLADFLLGGSSMLSLRLGRIDVRFAEPWSLRGFINDQVSRLSKVPRGLNLDFKDPENTELRHKLLRTLGYKVLADINDVSVVMPTALIGTVLLTLRGRGVSASALLHRVNWLMERVKAKGGRIAHFGNLDLKDVVRRGLEVLGKELVRVVPNETLVEETYEAVDPFQLSYYRNMTMHLFVSEALVSVSLYARVKRGGGPSIQDMPYEELYNQVQFLSSLFRGEFIFSNEGLEANLETTLKGMESDGVIRLDRNADGRVVKIGLSDGEREAQRENYDFYCFLLWPFVEAAWLAAVSLMGLTPPPGISTDTWIPVTKAQSGAQRLGMTLFHQGDLSYIEAVNKETLKNSYQRFQEEGIVEVTRSKDPKVPAKMRLSPDWLVPRDPKTGELTMSGRLFEFIDKIACSRREGKNRRDEKTIKSRAVVYADIIGQELFLEVAAAGKTIVSPEEEMDDRQGRHRRRLEDRSKL